MCTRSAGSPAANGGRNAATLLVVFEDIDWAALTAAHYDDPEMRALFAALASDDGHEVMLADEKLGSSIMLDSQVFESPAAAVPVLLDLVSTARHRRADWLWLVGMCADPAAAFGESLPMVQAALAAHVGGVIGFLDDPDPGVAAAAAYALVQCPIQPLAGTALIEHPDQVAAAMRGPGEGFIHSTTAQSLAEFLP